MLITKKDQEMRRGQYLLIPPPLPSPPPPTKEAKNRWANTAYVLYPKYAWDVMVREIKGS